MPELADLVTPSPPSWMPQTTGWLVVGLVILAGLAWLGWRAGRRWYANRHRRAALAELTRWTPQLAGDDRTRAQALLALAELLKRVALAEWPREAVAPLSGPGWHQFLHAHAGTAADAVPGLAALVDDAEYRGATVLAAWPPQQAHATADACRRWIAAYRRDSRDSRELPPKRR